MYAIVDIAGQQFKVEKDQKLFVHRLEGDAGSKLDFDKVLLIDNNQHVIVGTPVIEGAMVYATVLEHRKGDKVLVFKKKRRKGYRKLNGHKQYLTQILIEDIIEKGAKSRVSDKKVKPVTIKEPPAEIVTLKNVETPPATEVKKAAPKVTKETKTAVISKTKKTVKPLVKTDVDEKKVVAKKTKSTKKPVAAKKPVAKAKKPPVAKKTGGKTTK